MVEAHPFAQSRGRDCNRQGTVKLDIFGSPSEEQRLANGAAALGVLRLSLRDFSQPELASLPQT